MQISKFIFGAAVLTAAAASPGAVQEIVPARQYAECMALAQSAPERGFEMAVSWSGLGGGDAAKHCEAVSLFGLGHYDEAARRLEALAQVMRAEPRFRAQLFGQAGQAWLLAGAAERAGIVLSAAIDLAPDDAELRIDRGQAMAAQGGYFGAVQDLTAALDLDPERVDAYAFRASAHRHTGRADLAREDVTRAIALQPDHPEALLERGILNQMEDDKPAARRDWLAVIEIAPDSTAAQSARDYIERMDGPAAPPPAKASP
jgi:tetratricopeptide (TPR) repeat protein